MPVYVDNARNKFGRMIMCHMLADTIEELLEMADRIGLQRRHFQPGSHPHFDVSLAYRQKALSAGAIQVERSELVAVMKRQRQRLIDDPDQKRVFEAAVAASDKGRRAALKAAREACSPR
jgi:hypothetical protein